MLAVGLETLEALFDDACVYVHSSGSVDSKASYLRLLRGVGCVTRR